MRKELKEMLKNEVLVSDHLLSAVDVSITFDRFLSSFYYPEFHCLRYLWFNKEKKPHNINLVAFSLYLKILGFITYIQYKIASAHSLRYNILDNRDMLVCVESRIHKEELFRFVSEYDKPIIVYWIENYNVEKIQKIPDLTPLTTPTSLVSKATIGVDLTYCKYCCYDVFC